LKKEFRRQSKIRPPRKPGRAKIDGSRASKYAVPLYRKRPTPALNVVNCF
jgi:hypothetical protein